MIAAFFGVCSLLFVLGVAVLVIREEPILRLLGAQISLGACALAIITASKFRASIDGEVFAIFLLIVAACQCALGVALLKGRAR